MQPVVECCRDRINDLLQQQDIVRVACVDDRGIHRSVAVAQILQAVCEMKGYNSQGPYHIDKRKWNPQKMCFDCKDCRPNCAKNDLYKAVAKYW